MDRAYLFQFMQMQTTSRQRVHCNIKRKYYNICLNEYVLFCCVMVNRMFASCVVDIWFKDYKADIC